METGVHQARAKASIIRHQFLRQKGCVGMQIPRVRLKHASLVCDRTDDVRVTVAAVSYIVARIQVFNSIYVYET